MEMRRGEDIEHYANKYEERQDVLRDLAMEEAETEHRENEFAESQERKEAEQAPPPTARAHDFTGPNTL